ncbi:MAG: hexokinase [Sphaerochaetaceae bacterium]|nr:hexokinase [Sphaerochaetaceae bacterium]
MSDVVARTEAFLQKWKITPDAVDMEKVCGRFLDEMSRGLASHHGGSLRMIPTYATESESIAPGKSVIVLDAGGTNFRTCLVTFDEHFIPHISEFRKSGMPGVKEEVSAEKFFSLLADDVERLIDKSDKIGFCFSYAADILPNHDGVPVVFSKEIKAPEVIGKPVGASLLAELSRRGHDVSKKTVSVVNDTVATLLAGKAASGAASWDGFIGFILGTGTNTAYSELNSAITKIDCGTVGRQIINVESGSFDFWLGELDEKFFASTKIPSAYHFEKMISGAYLGPYSHMVVRQAIDDGLFSQVFADRFAKIEPLTTTTMSHYLEMPLNLDYALVRCVDGNEDDATALWMILNSFIARAAKLTAVNLSAAVLKSGKGADPRRPVCINADGTTYYKTEYLKQYTEYYLYEFLQRRKKRYVRFVRIEDSPVLGAAIAGLLG